ncbi:hypothetical protein ACWX0K_22345 [Nitrobacteraceae bacterium UC4446_H13]
MDRILYVLVGIGVAAAMISAFGTRPGFRPVGEVDVAVTAAFIWLLAFAAFILKHTRWGRRIDWRFKRSVNEKDAEVRANARNKGEVRTGCWWRRW